MALSDTKYTFIGVPNGYQRDLPFALDRSSIFFSKAEADVYASGVADKDGRGISGATSYVGQVIAVYTVDASDNITAVTIYKIDADRKLKSLETIEISVDNASIIKNDGTLELNGFASALDGAQPQVKLTYQSAVEGENADDQGYKLDENGHRIVISRELVWIVPSTETVDGMQKKIGELEKEVDDNAKAFTDWKDSNQGTIDDVTNKANKTDLAGMAHGITYENLTITIPMKAEDGVTDGEPLVINLPKDNFIRSGSYDAETQEIVLIVDDDTTDEATKEVRIPAESLVDVYTGVAYTENKKAITVKVSEDNKISAELEIDPASILEFTEDGKLTVDTEALNAAVDSKLDKDHVKDAISDETTYEALDVANVEATKTYVGEKIAAALEPVNKAHNDLDSEFKAHTHNGTDAPKISYNNLLDTPDLETLKSGIVEETDNKLALKQDKVVVMEKTLDKDAWVEAETGYTYELDVKYTIDGTDAALPENCVIDIAPATASDADLVLEAHFCTVVAASETAGSVVIAADAKPTADVKVVVKITPSVKVIA